VTPAILFAFGAMSAYVVLGLLHKLADRAGCRPNQINILLFGWSAVFSLVSLLVGGQGISVPLNVWAIALPSGACAATAILLFQIGVREGKIATSWLIINLSGAIPILISIILYREKVGLKQLVALLAMVASLILMWLERKQTEAAS
jgi:drug/metabolite transporter (DMT)-like permease